MTPEAAARQLERFGAELPRAALRAVEEAAKAARDRAIWWSSGPYSTAALRALYNPRGPYSVADPHPPDDPGRINTQRGAGIVGQWAIDPARVAGGRAASAVYNTAPEAGFMGHWDGDEWVQGEGSAMIARPLPVRVLAETEAPLRAALDKAIDGIGG